MEREEKNWEICPQLRQVTIQASTIIKRIPSTGIVSVFWCYLFIYFLKFGIKSDLRLGILTWLDCIKLFGLDLVLNKEFGLRMVLISVICVRFGFPLGYLGSIFFLVYLYTLKLSFYLFHFKFFVETFFPFITSFPMFLF